MPLINSSTYRPVPLLFNGHLETVVPSMFRKVENVQYQRERLELNDGDFLDLDWLGGSHTRLVIISHGLEGSSHRHYCMGMARYFFQQKWDALAWNCRSCSGEMNRLPRFYHHGATEDLQAVVNHALGRGYTTIALVGFSMGGSLSLKYAGEQSEKLPAAIKAIATFSVPCDLGSSAEELDKPANWFYRNRFLKKLEKKIRAKSVLFPEQIDANHFQRIRTFQDFDNLYTAPLHHFKNAADFYAKASAKKYLSAIEIPTLIVNAENDPFLPADCYPTDIAAPHANIFLEIPHRGGHVGFSLSNSRENWMELRALEFVHQFC
ncbi:MAG: YheT family hydrolase [Bacteroidota bacterium]